MTGTPEPRDTPRGLVPVDERYGPDAIARSVRVRLHPL